MGQYFLIEDFKAGLDRRRMNVTSPSGTLVTGENIHITRGGEIEKREKFTKFLTLPDDTFGLCSTPSGFLVFGSEDISGTYTNNVLNSNPPVRYQKLDPGGGVAMTSVLSVDLYDGIPYVIAEFDDGKIRHYYDGSEVTDWSSAKGRAKFSITAGDDAGAVSATGSFRLSNSFNGDEVTSITVDAVQLLEDAVEFVSGDTQEDFIQSIVDAINAFSTTSGYTADWAGNKITITAILPGAAENGNVIDVDVTGSVTISDIENMDDGADADEISDIQVDGSSIIDTPIVWAGSNTQTAAAVAASIKAYSGTSNYTASAYGEEVVIRAVADGSGANGDAVDITTTGSITIDPPSGITIEGGAAGPTVLEPGRFVKTVRTKVYVLADSLMNFSAVDDPEDFDPSGGGTGVGLENLSTNSAGSENLVAIANYFNDIAVFSKNNVQVWFVDPDPDNNAQLQVLHNTGAVAAGSVVEFGDNDVFYLSESGIRSLRARDSSNAAFVNDVGIAIDTIVQEKVLADAVAASNARGVLEPREGRYMLAIGSTVYVFSFFPSSKVSAWTTYELPFDVEGWSYSGQIVVCRSRNAIYQLGSVSGKVYDTSEATVVIPFLDAGTPAHPKSWTGIDAAATGTWKVYAALDPKLPDEFVRVGTLIDTTFNDMNAGVGIGVSTHISLKFVSTDDDGASIGKVAIHYISGDAE